jgi:hypothetical protein
MNYSSNTKNIPELILNQVQKEMIKKINKGIEKQISNAFGVSPDLLTTGAASSTYMSAKLQADMYKAILPGIQIVESEAMVDKKQIRKHKKKRINKKWIKRYGFKETPRKEVFQFENKIIGHPDTIKKIYKLINK